MSESRTETIIQKRIAMIVLKSYQSTFAKSEKAPAPTEASTWNATSTKGSFPQTLSKQCLQERKN